MPGSQGIQGVIKLGALIHHYAHHVSHHHQDGHLGRFVEMHFTDHDHHKEDSDAHRKLPFQHDQHQQNISLQMPFLLSESQRFVTPARPETTSNALTPWFKRWHSSLHASDIWQPPKA
ncbi:MAG: hypothetical protein IPJ06_02055 [Saprospiraceae bacterium]|nr:hypothetical protein [Saprospiraceae bacterium]